MTNVERATMIADAILADLKDRRGLDNEWDQIDEDVQEEIRQEWITIVLSRLKA